MMHLQFDAAAVLRLGTTKLWLHSYQSNEDTGSVWVSSHGAARPPRVYAAGCEPGTPLSYINANIGSYDTLREEIDIIGVSLQMPTHKYLNVVFDHGFTFSVGDELVDSDEIDV